MEDARGAKNCSLPAAAEAVYSQLRTAMTASDLPPAEPGAGAYAVPKADLNQPAVMNRPPRPSVGDVLLLAIVQVAGIAVTRILLRVLFGIAWSGYPIAGAVVGAAVFGALEKLHRPKASSLAYVFYLALWSAVPWILISSATMVVYYRTFHHAQSQALWWLLPVRRVLLAGVLSFAATFVGALIGTRGGTGPRV